MYLFLWLHRMLVAVQETVCCSAHIEHTRAHTHTGLHVCIVQSFSHVRLFEAGWTAALQASLSLTTPWSLTKFTSIASVVPSSHLTLFSFCPQSFPASWTFPVSQLFTSDNQNTGLSALVSVLPRSIQDWLPLRLTGLIQGTLRTLLQHYSSKASILSCSAFFMVHLPQPYMTTGKTIALIIWTFVGRVISLLFHTLSRFVIAFLSRSKCLIFMAAVIITVFLEPMRLSVATSTSPPFSLPWSNGAGCHDLSFSNI